METGFPYGLCCAGSLVGIKFFIIISYEQNKILPKNLEIFLVRNDFRLYKFFREKPKKLLVCKFFLRSNMCFLVTPNFEHKDNPKKNIFKFSIRYSQLTLPASANTFKLKTARYHVTL